MIWLGLTELLHVTERTLDALGHPIARNQALVDGNKRLGLAAVMAFDGVNGLRLTLTNDVAYDQIYDIAAGELNDVNDTLSGSKRLLSHSPTSLG